MEILAIIPARSGSKSVKDKNIREIAGKPMLAYSILHGLQSKYISRVIVSTDSEKYAEIARAYGAEVPFLRPGEYALDTSLDIEVFEHALKFLREKENYVPDIVVQLRPTYPIRNVADIDKMVEMMMEDETIDSIRCIAPAKEIPYKMWLKGENGQIHPLMTNIKECYNMPRQELPKVYYQNACIDVIRTKVITEQHSMSGEKIIGYEMTENFDIDTEEEFKKAAAYIETKGRKV
jgi:CMP-N-acetylneuraminic acid synthetase